MCGSSRRRHAARPGSACQRPACRSRRHARRSSLTRPRPGHAGPARCPPEDTARSCARRCPGCGSVRSRRRAALVSRTPAGRGRCARGPQRSRGGIAAQLRLERAQRGEAGVARRAGQQPRHGIDEIGLRHRPEGRRAVQRASAAPAACRASARSASNARATCARGSSQVAAEADVGRHPAHSRRHAAPRPPRRRRRRRRRRAPPARRRRPAGRVPRLRARPAPVEPCARARSGAAACSRVHHSRHLARRQPTAARSSSRS